MQLIVLGMHRSGTSVLARILNLMGCYLGPEGMSTGANPENPKGFWERRDVRQLNDALLHSVGCDWDRVASLDLVNIPTQMTQAFDEVAARTVLEMDAHRPWFIKEPRLGLLLPMWLRHLEVPVVVNVSRDPVEVAASLQRRNAIPMDAGLELWEYYTRAAAAATRSLPAVTVQHAELISGPAETATRLYRELVDLGVQGLRPASPRELACFVDDNLHRERRGSDGLAQYVECRQARIHRALIAGDGGWMDAWPETDWPALRAYERGLPPVPKPDPRKLRSSGYDAFMLDERMQAGMRRMKRIEARLDSRFEQQSGLIAQLSSVADGSAKGEPEMDTGNLPSRQQHAEESCEQARRELGQRYTELAAAARELAALRELAGDLERRLEGQATANGALERRAADLERSLSKTRRERKKLAAALDGERVRRSGLERRVAELVSSTSWRITAPVRAVAHALRRLLRR